MLICTAAILLFISACGNQPETANIYAGALYEARRVITDKDIWFGVFFGIPSDEKYIIEREEIFLEKRENGRWKNVDYPHANTGLFSGETGISEIFLYKPLEAGRYRVRMTKHIFDVPRVTHAGRRGGTKLSCEFDVIAHEAAPEPAWEISRLNISPHEIFSADIKISVSNPVLDRDNMELELLLTTDKAYTYGEPYEVEVLLDGQWYQAPFAPGMFNLPAYTINPPVENKRAACCPLDAVVRSGVLPAGQYRIIKEFELREYSPDGVLLSRSEKEFAMAEFIVKEILSSEDDYIEMMRGAFDDGE